MEQLIQILDIIEQYSASTWISLLGLLLFYLGTKPAFLDDQQQIKGKYIGAGIVVVLLGQALNLSDNFIERKITASQSFENLVQNERVKWVVRLIAYNEKSKPNLLLNNIKTLGRPGHDYIFVADYEELINYSITEAIFKLGGTRKGVDRVSAIIFPLDHGELIPANVRGLLQIVKKVDNKYSKEAGYKKFGLTDNLASESISNLSNTSRASWAWDEYAPYFTDYRQAVNKLRSSDYSALKYIGSINKDWNEFGYSEIVGMDIGGKSNKKYILKEPSGTSHVLSNFGARVFLIENHVIGDIPNRVMIDFTDLDNQKIPDFRGKFSGLY
ncbi:MAG: hypothetical protein COB30_003620 [Ectothiorhodospiraceae bacterium]|nr:hypothetical protein [Ectothiorhodospiraceae bacterium]